jgi:hypothetical protein
MTEDEDQEIVAALAKLAGQDAAAADDARAALEPTVGAGWSDRSYGLTGTGQATALEALRARATGPRTIPWP